MDLYKAIRELTEQRKQLDVAIATLESLIAGNSVQPPSRRGRKYMSEEERAVVSERMKKYWSAKRKEKEKDKREKDRTSKIHTAHHSSTS